MIIFRDENLKKIFPTPKEAFDRLMAMDGKIYRVLENRRTLRFEQGGEAFFIKQHFGVGWKEIFKNIFQCRLPVVSAKNEWQANNLLGKINIPTIKVLAYGKRGVNPAKLQSFILSEELLGCDSLEDFCKNWRPIFSAKQALIQQVAELAHKMHAAGMNHRDFYLCHLWRHQENGELYLMDLHRAQIRPQVPTRWLIKDISGLYFSSMGLSLTQRDVFRFLKHYFKSPLRVLLQKNKHFLKAVESRAIALYEKERGK